MISKDPIKIDKNVVGDKKMIIGIDGHMLGDRSGGNESYYTNILSEMTVNPSDKVYLFVNEGIDTLEFDGKFTIIRFNSSSSFKRNFVELNKLCKKYNIEVLHTQYFIPFIRSCKVVCTIHDICFEHYKNIFTKKEYIRQKLLIPYAAKKSEFIFTVSNHAKNDIVEHYHVNPEKVIVTYNAVNERFRVLDEKTLNIEGLRKQYNIGKSPYVLTVGNLQPRKNLPRLIEAFNNWKRDNFNDVKLVIVGKKAWMYTDILNVASSESGNIILTDYVSDEDLVRLYNGAEAFVYPSFFEGFGIPPLEAMACGTPVAVAKATSLPEVVGNAGLYFDPFNVAEIMVSINKLMSDAELRKELVEKGFQRKSDFQWQRSAELIMKAYHSCKH